MIQHIEQQAKYHTIVVMRTSLEPLARQFPHTIFTKNDIIDCSPEADNQDYHYNMEIDAVKYKFNGKKIILANFAKIRCVFQKQPMTMNKIISYASLQQKDLQFYLYLNSQDFIRVIPLAVFSGTFLLIFSLEGQKLLDTQESFKELSYLARENNQLSQKYYHYSSEFGLLSELHFMNNFVRGYRQFSCYRKQNGYYKHLILPKIYSFLRAYFPLAKL